jgi:hypothetical protein
MACIDGANSKGVKKPADKNLRFFLKRLILWISHEPIVVNCPPLFNTVQYYSYLFKRYLYMLSSQKVLKTLFANAFIK